MPYRAKSIPFKFEPDLESVILVSLMEAADRVDSTVGLQMAYLKSGRLVHTMI